MLVWKSLARGCCCQRWRRRTLQPSAGRSSGCEPVQSHHGMLALQAQQHMQWWSRLRWRQDTPCILQAQWAATQTDLQVGPAGYLSSKRSTVLRIVAATAAHSGPEEARQLTNDLVKVGRADLRLAYQLSMFVYSCSDSHAGCL